jgi:hypothetical protein
MTTPCRPSHADVLGALVEPLLTAHAPALPCGARHRTISDSGDAQLAGQDRGMRQPPQACFGLRRTRLRRLRRQDLARAWHVRPQPAADHRRGSHLSMHLGHGCQSGVPFQPPLCALVATRPLVRGKLH